MSAHSWWSEQAFSTAFRRGRFFTAAELRLAVLSMLEERPKHGYELMKELETRSGGSYKASAGTMYPTLQQLEDEGLVVCEQDGGRKVYRLTLEGQAELGRQRDAIEDIWSKTSHWGDWGPWVAGPFGAMSKAAFLATKRAAGDREKRKRIEEILERARRELETLV
jgi:DNA-binding PadR family transcriptional regulator